MAQQSPAPAAPVLIIGAGIAGLTLAQGLRLRSVPFRLFERHPREHAAQGHRFRVSPDGHAALHSALAPPLQRLLRQTAADVHRFAPRYVDAAVLEFPAPTPPGPDATAPVDRAWLRALLTLDLQDAVEYGRELASYEVIDDAGGADDGQRVRACFADGSVARGSLLVGADGLRSRVRRQLQPARRLLDLQRWILWGRSPLTAELRAAVPPDMLSWCMYLDPRANVQVVVEPMLWSRSVARESAGRLPDVADYIYWCVCTAPFQYAERMPRTTEEKRHFLEGVTAAWHPALRQLLVHSAAHDMSACVPVLSSRPDVEMRATGQTGRVTLIGDAAHAMSPMGGSGGDTAIMNAADLARTVAEEGVTKSSIAGFEARMEALAKEKIEHSFRGGQKFWQGKEWTEYGDADV